MLADLKQAIVMRNGKEQDRALHDFDLRLNEPLGGWAQTDARLLRELGLMV